MHQLHALKHVVFVTHHLFQTLSTLTVLSFWALMSAQCKVVLS